MTDPTAVEQAIAEVEATGEPHTITRDGQPVAVIVEHGRWQAMLDRLDGNPPCEVCGQPVDPAHCVVDADPHLLRQRHWHPECEGR